MQNKLDQKSNDYCQVPHENFLDYLYFLKVEDRLERAKKQRLCTLLKKVGLMKATKSIKSRRIPKKDKHKNISFLASSLTWAIQMSKKDKSNKYCTLCAANDTPEHVIHIHSAHQCHSKEHYEKKISSPGKHAKKDSGSNGPLTHPIRSRKNQEGDVK
jgi:hypothetical protein